MGGNAVLKKYSKAYFKKLIQRRWELYHARVNASAEGRSMRKMSAPSAKKLHTK